MQVIYDGCIKRVEIRIWVDIPSSPSLLTIAKLMGNSASKAAKTAAEASKRQYPTRIPPVSISKQAPPISAPSATEATEATEASEKKKKKTKIPTSGKQAVSRETFDPQFGAALRSLGPVQPSSSTVQSHLIPNNNDLGGNRPIFPDPRNNPALIVLEARRRFAQEADAEIEQYGRKGFQGKRFLDVTVIRQILVMRDDDHGKSDAEIEEALELYPGTVSKLSRNVFSTPAPVAQGEEREVRR